MTPKAILQLPCYQDEAFVFLLLFLLLHALAFNTAIIGRAFRLLFLFIVRCPLGYVMYGRSKVE